ncbi:MAG: sugar phosphate isomerase/epimerase family protein [Halobacteriota archaeon]
MKVGFSALALFGLSFDKIMERASCDGFDVVEVLCEGPYLPRVALKNTTQFEILSQYDLELTIHSPTVDLNPASVNIGIREETTKQLNETVDLAASLDASTVTTHPGYVKRINPELTTRSLKFALKSLEDWALYAQDVGIEPSIENMPRNSKYFCTDVAQHKLFVETCGTSATVDVGHAHTSGSVKAFLQADFQVACYHLSDNDGRRDQHLPIGKGTIEWDQLGEINKAIIELNDYNAVKQSRDALIRVS